MAVPERSAADPWSGSGVPGTTRVQFLVAVVLVLLGIAAVVAYGWRALSEASSAAENAQASLVRIGSVARFEERLHAYELATDEPTRRAAVPGLLRTLSAMESADWVSDQERALVGRIGTVVREVVAREELPRAFNEAEQLTSELEEAAIRASQETIEHEGEAPARERSHRIVRLGVIAVVIFGIVASLVYLRLRRERRAALAELRRNDRLAALGKIAASVAHEINNPLATIAGCASAVRSRMEPGREVDADSIEYVEMIEGEVRRCSGIVSSLQDLARDTSLAITNARLDEIVEEVSALLAMDRAENAAEILVDATEPVELMCDPDKVKQLLLNLFVNARDAYGEAGGPVHVSVRHDHEQGQAVLVVRDTGQGIERRELRRVFDAFHTGKAKGLGIGLFLCQRIVALHGGTIRVESDGPGKGATFTVHLPTRV